MTLAITGFPHSAVASWAVTVDIEPRCEKREDGRFVLSRCKVALPNNGVLGTTSRVKGQDKGFLFRRFDGASTVIGPYPGDGPR